jgi:hypothetical protein
MPIQPKVSGRGNSGKSGESRKSRSTHAQGAVELVAALVCLTPIALCLFDLGIVAAGAALNDAVCRDSARAAASGPPSDLTVGTDRTVASDKSPYQRAEHVIKTMYATNIPAKVKDTIAVRETVADVPPPPVGGAISGEVSVETTVDIYPPFLIGAIMGNSGVSLKAKHIVPITYVVPDSSP